MVNYSQSRLLERLYHLADPDVAATFGRATRGDSTLATSIKGNLRRLLATRRGSVKSAPDLGFELFEETSLPDPFDVALALKQMIESYEPRLKAVTVQRLQHNNPQALAFEIRGDVGRVGGDKLTLQLLLESNLLNILS